MATAPALTTAALAPPAAAAAVPSASVPRGQVDLVDFIDWTGVECLNQDPAHPIANALKQGYREDEGLHLASDSDEQLLIYIPFMQVIKLHSALFKGPEEEGPKTVKLFSNREHMGFRTGVECLNQDPAHPIANALKQVPRPFPRSLFRSSTQDRHHPLPALRTRTLAPSSTSGQRRGARAGPEVAVALLYVLEVWDDGEGELELGRN